MKYVFWKIGRVLEIILKFFFNYENNLCYLNSIEDKIKFVGYLR